MVNSALYVGLGMLTGIISGMFGIGGGIILIPALVFFFGFTQHAAQGTTMALLVLPIGFFAALEYYRHGNVDIRVGALIALGFFVGGFFLVLPIGFFAALEYYRHGNVDIRVGVLIALGFFVGGFFGARIATELSEAILTRVFGVGLVLIGIRMIIS